MVACMHGNSEPRYILLVCTYIYGGEMDDGATVPRCRAIVACMHVQEMEKIALAESTGLEQKQINNWFINQRKRHWKPSEEMQFAVMDGFHPALPNAPALYVDARLVGATPAMFYARPEHGAHGLWHN